jgi:hypothetical protein
MDSEWVKVPEGAVRVGRERAVRLTAGMSEPLAPVPGNAMYISPVTFWWRGVREPDGAPPVAINTP